MKKRVKASSKALYERLEAEVLRRNCCDEISPLSPDPLLIASRYKDEYSALVCALFAYGNVRAIVRFLEALDFSLLESSQECIRNELTLYYRFQSVRDVQEFFITLSCLKQKHISLERLFLEGYMKHHNVMDGLQSLIGYLYDANPYRSKGYQFLLSKIPSLPLSAPYKRWHLYLRWMVRKDCLDLGLWQGVSSRDLLMPLDVHTFNVGKKLGLITHSRYDFKAVMNLTEALRTFDNNDPVKYDFALYRLGQERILL
jgi:uncharacterized protein (TIGR02757 family)